MKKRGFTLLEMIIVVIVLVVMFAATRNYFSSKNKIYYQAETCINNAYNIIKEINNASVFSRTRALSGAYSSLGNNIENPERYTLLFRPASIWPPYTGHTLVRAEIVTGFVRTLRNTPSMGNSYLGTYQGATIYGINILSWMFLYRGTGTVDGTIGSTNELYKIYYFPIGGNNFDIASTQYIPLQGCVSKDYFVTYNIGTIGANTGTTVLRVGFQNNNYTGSLNRKNMIIWPGQRTSGNTADLVTGAVSFLVCDRSVVRCKETSRIFFDTRVNNVFLQTCTTYNASNKCTARQGGSIN